ncbi:MAG TPA: ECF-type sigma factor [Pirellulaceae bacterium]|nr:ECF-type sigma factor [Pirellulaceae bacterium]
MSDVTHILSKIESSDPAAAEQLLPLVYEELRKLAAAKLAHEKVYERLKKLCVSMTTGQLVR